MPRPPPEKFDQLAEETRRYLESLEEEDLETLDKMMEFHRRAQTISSFLRWAILLIVGVFMAMVSFGEGIRTVITWFKNGAP